MRHLSTYQDWRRIQESQAYIDGEVINEGEVSDWLHTAADFVSIAADIVAPGSGAVIDIVQAISYFLEGFVEKDPAEAGSLVLSGLVTLGSLALVGPMQALATRMKGYISTVRDGIVKGASPAAISAARTASGEVVKFLIGAISSVSSIGPKISDLVIKAAESKLGTWIISKFGSVSKFTNWISDTFTKKIPGILKTFSDSLAKLNPSASGAGSVDDLTIKKYSKGYAGEYAEGKIQDRVKEIITMGNNEVSKSGISKSLKYSVFNVPNRVKYQQDTTNDYKPKEPIVPKKKVS
jgi:hypothetical protein